MEELWRVGESFGVSAVVLVIMGLGLWKALKWLGEEFLIPVRNSFLKHLEKIGIMMDSVPGAIEAIKEHSRAAAELLDRVSEGQDKILETGRELIGTKRSLAEILDASMRAAEASKETITKSHYEAIIRHLRAAKKELSNNTKQSVN